MDQEAKKKYIREYMRKKHGHTKVYNKEDEGERKYSNSKRTYYTPSKKIECECGDVIQEGNIERHEKSINHKVNILKRDKKQLKEKIDIK